MSGLSETGLSEARSIATTPRELVASGPRPRDRVVVAMSGGVDSSVAAALLVAQGCEVVGISLRLADHRERSDSSGCCSLDDFRDAARVAGALGVPHYVFDMRREFEDAVIKPFASEYLAGRTPSPCIICNREIKFSLLHEKARELGAKYIATGHYARREYDGARFRLRTGLDGSKDQSYFLFELGQDELSETLFPIGELDKSEVRRLAGELGLDVASKPDSQEICFVADGRYAEFVEKIAAERTRPGRIVDQDGKQIGSHDGVHRYTVGQRRGLGVAAAEPLYVSELRADAAEVVAVPRDRLGRIGLVAHDVSWTSGEQPAQGNRCAVRIRHRHSPVGCTLERVAGDRAVVFFDNPQEGVSPGQAAVFYDGDEVVGGGWIAASIEDGTCA